MTADRGVIELPDGTAVRSVRRDGVFVWKVRCPECGEWGEIDDDQLHGRVSMDHTDIVDGCTWHVTRDLAAEMMALP